jgi:hypothetical protein
MGAGRETAVAIVGTLCHGNEWGKGWLAYPLPPDSVPSLGGVLASDPAAVTATAAKTIAPLSRPNLCRGRPGTSFGSRAAPWWWPSRPVSVALRSVLPYPAGRLDQDSAGGVKGLPVRAERSEPLTVAAILHPGDRRRPLLECVSKAAQCVLSFRDNDNRVLGLLGCSRARELTRGLGFI